VAESLLADGYVEWHDPSLTPRNRYERDPTRRAAAKTTTSKTKMVDAAS
jgi:hypothetical protein